MTTHTEMTGNRTKTTYSPAPLADALKNNFPEISQVSRLSRVQSANIIVHNETFNIHNFYWADPGLFNIFTFQILRGNTSDLLSRPNSVVISQKVAQQYFHNANDLVNQKITLSGKVYIVSGVFKNLPANSHFHPEFIANFQYLNKKRDRDWSDLSTRTYFLLNKHTNIHQIKKNLPAFTKRVASGNHFVFKPQALTAIHLHSHLYGELEANGDITNVYVLSIIAFFLLFVAIANFVNLSISQGERRAKEIGVRKVLGSDKNRIKLQFYTEAFLYVILSCIVAIATLKISIPYLNHLFDQNIHLTVNGTFLAALLGIIFITVLGAGFYPANYLSSYSPSKVLKGNFKNAGSFLSLKNGLVVLQLMISMSLIGCALVVLNQLNYINHKDLGFSYRDLIVINLGTGQQRGNFNALKNKLLQHPEITEVTSAVNYPGRGYIHSKLWTMGMKSSAGMPVQMGFIGTGFFNVFGMHIIKGKSFEDLSPGQLKHAVIINEVTIRKLGLHGPVIGDKISRQAPQKGKKQNYWDIVGVVKNFNSASLREPIPPVVLYPVSFHVNLIAKINSANKSKKTILGMIRNNFKQVNSRSPFVYSFLENTLAKNYAPEAKLFDLFKIFSLLTIIISCLGLFGLVAYSARQRSKEFAIRKVIGATFQQLTLLISQDIIKLLAMAFMISCPIIYLSMQYWLSGFAYKTPISLWLFLAAGCSVGIIAFLTISYHVIKVSKLKPVENIRVE